MEPRCLKRGPPYRNRRGASRPEEAHDGPWCDNDVKNSHRRRPARAAERPHPVARRRQTPSDHASHSTQPVAATVATAHTRISRARAASGA